MGHTLGGRREVEAEKPPVAFLWPHEAARQRGRVGRTAGRSYPVTKRSSRHIWSAVKSCDATTRTEPSSACPPACEEAGWPLPPLPLPPLPPLPRLPSPWLLSASAAAMAVEAVPTVSTPANTSSIATQWCAHCFRRRYVALRTPVKMITEPRSI